MDCLCLTCQERRNAFQALVHQSQESWKDESEINPDTIFRENSNSERVADAGEDEENLEIIEDGCMKKVEKTNPACTPSKFCAILSLLLFDR